MVQGPDLEAELSALNRLVPHVRQAVQLHRQFAGRVAAANSLAAVIDVLPDASFVLNSEGEVLYSNRAARDLIARETVLVINDARFAFREKSVQDAFVRSSIQVVRSSMGREAYYSETLFLDWPGRAPLMLIVRSIESNELMSGGALVTVYDLLTVNCPVPKRSRRIFP